MRTNLSIKTLVVHTEYIITPVPGLNIILALSMHLLNSLGSIRCWAAYMMALQANLIVTITFESYRVPIYTPGLNAAMWIKCLTEGQHCQ